MLLNYPDGFVQCYTRKAGVIFENIYVNTYNY